MGKIYTRFIALKKQAPKDWFMDKVGLVKFEDDNKKYEIYFTRKRAKDILFFIAKTIRLNGSNFPFCLV